MKKRQTFDGQGNLLEEVDLPDTPESLIAQKRQEARERAIAAIKANAPASPWGKILKDLAVALCLMEPD